MRKSNEGKGIRRAAHKVAERPTRRTRAGARAGSNEDRAPAKPKGRVRSQSDRKKKQAAAPAVSKRRTAPAKAAQPRVETPEDMLQRAMAAATPRARALWARRGLASPRRLDRTTQSMLLRQLYLAYYEDRRFAKALDVSRQALALAVLPDVVHQDAARAAQALGDVDAAAGHLRLAARTGPAKRRAFHLWTLGSLLFLAGRHAEAVSALSRAARWGTTDKPLYQGHLAIARRAGGEPVDDMPDLIQKLASVPAGQGYGRFILGHLAFYERRWDEARAYLSAFVDRSTGGRAALAIALEGEIALAKQTLSQIPRP